MVMFFFSQLLYSWSFYIHVLVLSNEVNCCVLSFNSLYTHVLVSSGQFDGHVLFCTGIILMFWHPGNQVNHHMPFFNTFSSYSGNQLNGHVPFLYSVYTYVVSGNQVNGHVPEWGPAEGRDSVGEDQGGAGCPECVPRGAECHLVCAGGHIPPGDCWCHEG